MQSSNSINSRTTSGVVHTPQLENTNEATDRPSISDVKNNLQNLLTVGLALVSVALLAAAITVVVVIGSPVIAIPLFITAIIGFCLTKCISPGTAGVPRYRASTPPPAPETTQPSQVKPCDKKESMVRMQTYQQRKNQKLYDWAKAQNEIHQEQETNIRNNHNPQTKF
jgi:hypothetical protein